jgi:hypothetical protein
MVAKAPALWQRYYQDTNRGDPQQIARSNLLRGPAEEPLIARLNASISSYAPAAIVCTHFLPAEVLARQKLSGNLRAAIYTTITDHVAHSFWVTPGVDGYFVASEVPRELLIVRGVPGAIIHVIGTGLGRLEEPANRTRRAGAGLEYQCSSAGHRDGTINAALLGHTNRSWVTLGFARQ